jgi:hypothetical protein
MQALRLSVLNHSAQLRSGFVCPDLIGLCRTLLRLSNYDEALSINTTLHLLAARQGDRGLPRLRLAILPMLDYLSTVLSQVLMAAYRRIGDVVAHAALPQDAVEGIGIDPVGIGEVKTLRLCRPPRRVVQLQHGRSDLGRSALACWHQVWIDRRRA